MKLVKTSFSQKIALKNILKIIITVIIIFTVSYFLLSLAINQIIIQKSWLNVEQIAFATALILALLVISLEIKLLNKIDELIDRWLFALKNALKGNYGEKKTFEELKQKLGNRYRVYRNFDKIPEHNFDIDAIVVGPKGIIAFEIKNIGNENDLYLFEGKDTYKINTYPKGNVNTLKFGDLENPVSEAKRHNLALEEWLHKNGFEGIKVRGAIVMVSGAKIKMENPDLFVINGLNNIGHYFDKAFEDSRFIEEFCLRLDKLISIANLGHPTK